MIGKTTVNLIRGETVDTILDKLHDMEFDFKYIMESGSEDEKDLFLDKALTEVEKLNGRSALYRIWYMAFCDLRDGFKTDY